jgi:hypothetical protein
MTWPAALVHVFTALCLVWFCGNLGRFWRAPGRKFSFGLGLHSLLTALMAPLRAWRASPSDFRDSGERLDLVVDM